jgi:hypothetical protein
MISATSSGDNIDITHFPNKTYFVQILHNNTIATAKLLKQ